MSNLFPAGSIEPLSERKVKLGSLEVYRLLPVRGRRLIGPWCFFDRYGPLTFQGCKPMDVPPHPHTGLQTVTWLFAGEVVHHDSLGSECLVRPGQLSLMTAGHGIAHTEETPGENSGALDGVQLWVALPDASRSTPPQYQCTSRQPSLDVPGGVLTAVMGEFAGLRSQGVQFSPGVGVDVRIHPRQRVALPLHTGYEYGVLLAGGDASIESQSLQPNQLYYLGSGRDEFAISSHDGARLMLIGGEPFGESILMWWNFVARTVDEIQQARAAWQARERFGEVTAYKGERLDAPAFLGTPIASRPASG